MNRKTVASVTSSVVLASLLTAVPALAETTAQNSSQGSEHGRAGFERHAQGVVGVVASISGNSITITSKEFGRKGSSDSSTTSKTYTIDASNATVEKSGSTASLASIAVGDTIFVDGTVSGTNVTAKTIRTGAPQGARPEAGKRDTSIAIKGNGQPVVGGTVSSVNGSSISITNESNVSYTIDASGATITKQGATSTISSVASGDRLLVQGSVNGTSVVASSIIDQGAAAATAQSGSNATQGQTVGSQQGGFFGAVGGFFHRLFGFF